MPQNMIDLALANPGLAAGYAFVLYAMLYGVVMARVNRQRRILIAATQRKARGLPNGAVIPVPYRPNWFIRVWPDTGIRIALALVIVGDIAHMVYNRLTL